jgi:subtilisin family serine protease
MPRPRRIAGVLVGVLIGATATGLPAHATPAATPAATPVEAERAQPARVTLITGDVVQLAPATGGRTAATVIPAPGREGITFKTFEVDGSLRVVPSDAIPLLDSGRVDAELFDVQRLVDQGYGDAASATLPLIVQGGTAAFKSAGPSLSSIGAVALKPAKSGLADFWKSQTGPSTLAAADRHIWLDGKVKAALQQSTEQIGAPTAWQAGLDGTGVKVAVLDTGVDATHPDLAGRIAEQHNFSSSEDTVDRFGHGTHVASTIAGTGAASGGIEKGVAPGAQLLIGKVLGDDGTGYESSIIEGMQWAVADGAKVVSMSLGGDPTDGTDPMAAAVNELSARSGALFVVAAGNSGADSSVGTPGSATSALTVGAVDSADKLADFSSRGPRLGDQGLKPEITAPGVDIVAARAAGTTMGDPVDAYYTAASGTSMATPHVAGAAAIMAEQHPGWTGQQIKSALISTAKTSAGTDVYGQGAGRVDVARAVTQSVDGTGVLDFGEHTTGDAAVTKTLTYTNGGKAAVTLKLAVPAIVTASAATVTVPAGGSAAVSVKYSPTGRTGKESGWITATATGGVQVTTAVGAVLDGPKHTVTLSALDRKGQPVAVPALTIFGDDSRDDVLSYLGAGPRSYELQEGTYILDAVVEDGGPLDEQATLVTLPELKVTKDVTLVLDARKGRPIKIETPRPAEQQAILSYYTHRVLGSGREIDNGTMHFSTVQQVNVTPTAKVGTGSFEFSSRWQLVEPMVQPTVPGVAGPLDINLLGTSPAFDGVRAFPLAVWGAASVRGKAVLIPSTQEDEQDQVAAAAKAGAAVALLVRPVDWSAWTAWQPDAEERLPIVSAAVANDDGQRLLARAAKPGATIALKLTTSSPYLYDVLQVSPGQVPSQIVYRVTTANSQVITSRYADNGGFDWVREQRFGWRPWQQYAWNDTNRAVLTPSVREEWVSAGDSVWQHNVHQGFPWGDSSTPLQGGFTDGTHSYHAGRSAETWAGPVVRPASLGSTRTGSVLHLRVADFVDSSNKHYTIDEADQAGATLTRNGTVLATLPDAWQDVTTTAGMASYQLRLTTARAGDDWQYGTKTDTTWSFKSGAEGPLPLLTVNYAAPVGLTGLAPKRAHVLKVTAPGAISTKLEISTDDGARWRTAIRGLIPAGTAPVSLRVTARDQAGNAVTQTVIRAYGRG